ncbi:MAG: porin family protein [Bacteroidales bacterium]
MKKKYLFLILILLFAINASAQLKFGAKAGVTSTSIKADEVYTNLSEENYDQLEIEGQNMGINGFQVGVFSRLSIAALYVQPELLFSKSTAEIKITEIDQGDIQDEFTEDQEFSKIDIPLMAGWKFGPARVQAGPVASIILDNKSAIEAATDYKEEFNGATWGYQVGVGLDLLNTLTLDVKYEGGLSKLGDGVDVGGEEPLDFDSRPNQFIFSVGLFF